MDHVWQGWQDLNLRMRESKSRALPLGDTPTHDIQSHNLALCQLNYTHQIGDPPVSGEPRGIRTPDLRLRRPLLYPAELSVQMERVMGIGPTQPAWKAGVLPLNYTRITECA